MKILYKLDENSKYLKIEHISEENGVKMFLSEIKFGTIEVNGEKYSLNFANMSTETEKIIFRDKTGKFAIMNFSKPVLLKVKDRKIEIIFDKNLTIYFIDPYPDDVKLIQEITNSTSPGEIITVRLFVENSNESSNITKVNLTDYFPSGWTVVDNGGGTNLTNRIYWNFSYIYPDNMTTVYYKIKAPSTMGTYTFNADVEFEYPEGTGSVNESSDINVSRAERAFYEFEFDVYSKDAGINRTMANDTTYTAKWTITNVGDTDASLMPDLSQFWLIYNTTEFNVTETPSCPSATTDYNCTMCELISINATHNATHCNFSEFKAGASASIILKIRSTIIGLDGYLYSKASYDPYEGWRLKP